MTKTANLARRAIRTACWAAALLVATSAARAEDVALGTAVTVDDDRPKETAEPPATSAPGASAVTSTDAAGGAALAATPQILPVSPVAGANDPNASNDALYVLESNDEEAARRARLGRTAHLFVGPSARLAFSRALSPVLTVEAFATGNLTAFDKMDHGFGTRTSSVSGGVNATGDLTLFNFSLAYEHRDARTEFFGPWAAESDKVGITVNKTYPLFVRNLRFTPQLQSANEVVDPMKSSSINVEATAGLTYDATPRLSFAVSLGYQAVFLYGLPGHQHNGGLKVLLGATYKATDRLTIIAGATTSSTALYRLPTYLADGGIDPAAPAYRADGSISPSLTVKYQIIPGLTASVVANYGRFLSTAPGQSTYKYSINPSIALSVPL